MARKQKEQHLISRTGWLRAAVLGANDGIISTASLVLGVVSTGAPRHQAVVAAVAGLVAGAMSMAAGEYVSVSSQADTEAAEKELAEQPKQELEELTQIYVGRGVEPDLAREVARQLTDADALAAHSRDELGINEATAPRPVQAAMASAVSFSAGAVAPLLLLLVAPGALSLPIVAGGSLVGLSAMGMLAAKTGGASILRPTLRVTFWGALAMAVTMAVGALFGTTV
jgi:VIT1/CCC1 family predicted Fe2+/Mn2+ transporter